MEKEIIKRYRRCMSELINRYNEWRFIREGGGC